MITIASGGDGTLESYRSQKAECAAENFTGAVSNVLHSSFFMPRREITVLTMRN